MVAIRHAMRGVARIGSHELHDRIVVGALHAVRDELVGSPRGAHTVGEAAQPGFGA
jgi:hypothetical protein